jgi:hypothetical protein
MIITMYENSWHRKIIYTANDEVYAVKDLDSGTENNGLFFSVHAAKFSDAISIDR